MQYAQVPGVPKPKGLCYTSELKTPMRNLSRRGFFALVGTVLAGGSALRPVREFRIPVYIANAKAFTAGLRDAAITGFVLPAPVVAGPLLTVVKDFSYEVERKLKTNLAEYRP